VVLRKEKENIRMKQMKEDEAHKQGNKDKYEHANREPSPRREVNTSQKHM
jgi:hypothetical protein